MTKLLVYGYCTGVFSSRRIQKRILEDIPFKVLAAGNEPDFWTISDSRKIHLESLKKMFEQVLAHPNWVNVMGGTFLITAGRTYTASNGTFEDAPMGICGGAAFTATYTQPLSVTVDSGTTYFPIRTNHWTSISAAINSGHQYNQSNDVNVSYP